MNSRVREIEKQRIRNEKLQKEIELKALEYKIIQEKKALQKREEILNRITKIKIRKKERDIEQFKVESLNERKDKIEHYYKKIQNEINVQNPQTNMNSPIIISQNCHQINSNFLGKEISSKINNSAEKKVDVIKSKNQFELEHKSLQIKDKNHDNKYNTPNYQSPFLNLKHYVNSRKMYQNKEKQDYLLKGKFRERMKEYSKYIYNEIDREDPLYNKKLKNDDLKIDCTNNQYFTSFPLKLHFTNRREKDPRKLINSFSSINNKKKRYTHLNNTENKGKKEEKSESIEKENCGKKCELKKELNKKELNDNSLGRWEHKDSQDLMRNKEQFISSKPISFDFSQSSPEN